MLLVHAGAGSGMGGKLAPQATEALRTLYTSAEFEVIETKGKEHIREVGCTTEADLVICLSGDGCVHDLAQSLLARPRDNRPTLASIPAGSGNDYARSLGIPSDCMKAIALLPVCEPLMVDVGRVNDTYFLETLSFGMDAAVAINTEKLRLSTQSRGIRLYARAAIKSIIHEFNELQATMKINEETHTLSTYILAIQNGPTYGGGFRVAPFASIVDGMFDVYTVSGIGKLKALYYLTKLKDGKHVDLKEFSSYKTSKLELEFAEQPPAQCDGEKLTGQRFSVSLLPAELKVLASSEASIGQMTK
ncbi:MAG: YegS/Rv2252/BmrU family lipid kinase [Coriobacteriia bacterium]|nr:YegS/Rv2252/BmrU family lipid kinase [Coriobacteriia bacterium]